ncbi:MAG: segregation/condensation protein A [Alphaproteobacteria bacterium]|nr:segregation/condensation protein A [Alphaproteobacteria bacterium]
MSHLDESNVVSTVFSGDELLVVDLDGYEGPLDVLLSLARAQKVDLTKISILALAEQYLAFVAEVKKVRIEIAADYLVMAAWLAYLKSRLLLPEGEHDEEPSGEVLAADLASRLRRLDAFRQVGQKLFSGFLLGRDVFPRGAPEGVRVIKAPVYEVSLFELLKAYAEHKQRAGAVTLMIEPKVVYTFEQATRRLTAMLGMALDWLVLEGFLPPELVDDFARRTAIASTLSASLELVRQGKLDIRQATPFGPIFLRKAVRENQ